jgi:hypothetical protein
LINDRLMVWITGHRPRELVHYCCRIFARAQAAFDARAGLRGN